jgi:hypothetical protein
MDIIFLLSCAALAGYVDAIVGGGGLILVPAFFTAYPNAIASTLLGNNKSVSVWGTLFASWNYSRHIDLPWRKLFLAALFAGACSFLGAWTLNLVSSEFLKKALPWVLLSVLVYTMLSKKLGRTHEPRFQGHRELLALLLVAGVIGFYDGFFGPGTGSFFIFIFVRLLHYDFLHASGAAKVLNTASNAAALSWFVFEGKIWWAITLPMAVCNILGSLLGTKMAVKHGSSFVRWIFMGVVTCLILKTAKDAYLLNAG